MYQINYQLTHDIDWFAIIDRIPVHVATNGGLMPRDSYKVRELARIQHLVNKMEVRYQVGINKEYLERYLTETEAYPGIDEMTNEDYRQMLPEKVDINRNLSRSLNAYTWSFVEMASKGFMSFDRRVDEDNWTGYYHLVAWPKTDSLPEIPEGMYNILEHYSYNYIFQTEPKDSTFFWCLPLLREIRKEK